MKGKRTNIDFSKHIHTTCIIDSPEKVRIDHLKIPDSIKNGITLINTNGIMAVTGYFGNWIFNREINPTEKNYFTDFYLIEKLLISSTQIVYHFDPSETQMAIIEELKTQDALTDEEINYLNMLLDNLNRDGLNYENILYEKKVGRYIDEDNIPYKKIVNQKLLCVFDCLDAIYEKHNTQITEEVNN